MSTKGEVLRHPVNGSTEQTWDGFSWPALFFSSIWMLVKGLFGHFLITLLVIIVTAGFAGPIIWIVYAIKGNELHKSSLLKKGYLTEDQWRQKEQRATPTAPRAAMQPQRDHAAQLRDLADLRDKGVLTEAEFAAQKAKLLGP